MRGITKERAASKLKYVETIIKSVSNIVEIMNLRRFSIRINNLNKFFEISFLLSIIRIDFCNIIKVF